MPFDDDAEADPPGFRPPPHPDDRLWRHPSEVSADPAARGGAPGRGPWPGPGSPARGARPARRRPWGALVLAGTVGAVLAGGGVIVLGLDERVVERKVTERVTLEPHPPLGAGEGTIDGVRRLVSPAVIALEAAPAEAGDGAGAGDRPGTGTGVVVRDDGIVVTSAAFAAAGVAPIARRTDGTAITAELIGFDPATGLAVLDLVGTGYTPSVLARSADLPVGAPAFALRAEPGGGTATERGVVGPAQRYLGPTGDALDGLEIEGPAEATALGGPLVDARGAVVGIVTAVEEDHSWYAAPVDVVHRVAGDLLAEGIVRHAWLGIEVADIPPAGDDGGTGVAPDDGGTRTAPGGGGEATMTAEDDLHLMADEGGGAGTLVASVVEGSPAALGGLAPGDVIVGLDGDPIARLADLTIRLRSRAPGERVEVTVQRPGGARATLLLTLAEAPAR